MSPEGKKIILHDQRDLEIALAGARQARPLRGQALGELFALEDDRPPHTVSPFTAERVINGLKRIALRNIKNPYIPPKNAEKLLKEELGIHLETHRI
jgi:hypothetical protein